MCTVSYQRRLISSAPRLKALRFQQLAGISLEVISRPWYQLEAGNEPADLRHTEGNWQKFSGSGAPFSALILTRITARKASANIDKVMCRYQPCQLRTS